MSLIEEKSTYSKSNLVFVAKMSDGKFFNGLLDKSLKKIKTRIIRNATRNFLILTFFMPSVWDCQVKYLYG